MKRLKYLALATLVAFAACDEGETPTAEDDVTVGTVSVSVQDDESQGVAGVTVTLAGAAGQSEVTGSSGSVTFSSVVEGNYTVAISSIPADYVCGTTSQPVAVTDAQPNPTAGFSCQIVRTASISGMAAAGGLGVEGVEITIDGPEGTDSKVTDANGNYAFTGLRSGEYDVEVTDDGPDDDVTFNGQAFEVDLEVGESEIVNFSGTRTERATLRGSVTASGQPVPGVTVSIEGPSAVDGQAGLDCSSGCTRATGADGFFTFVDLEVGTYDLEISGWDTDTYNFETTTAEVTLVEGMNDVGSLFNGEIYPVHASIAIERITRNDLLGGQVPVDRENVYGDINIVAGVDEGGENVNRVEIYLEGDFEGTEYDYSILVCEQDLNESGVAGAGDPLNVEEEFEIDCHVDTEAYRDSVGVSPVVYTDSSDPNRPYSAMFLNGPNTVRAVAYTDAYEAAPVAGQGPPPGMYYATQLIILQNVDTWLMSMFVENDERCVYDADYDLNDCFSGYDDLHTDWDEDGLRWWSGSITFFLWDQIRTISDNKPAPSPEMVDFNFTCDGEIGYSGTSSSDPMFGWEDIEQDSETGAFIFPLIEGTVNSYDSWLWGQLYCNGIFDIDLYSVTVFGQEFLTEADLIALVFLGDNLQSGSPDNAVLRVDLWSPMGWWWNMPWHPYQLAWAGDSPNYTQGSAGDGLLRYTEFGNGQWIRGTDDETFGEHLLCDLDGYDDGCGDDGDIPMGSDESTVTFYAALATVGGTPFYIEPASAAAAGATSPTVGCNDTEYDACIVEDGADFPGEDNDLVNQFDGINTDQDFDVDLWGSIADRFQNVSILNCDDDSDTGFGCGDNDGSQESGDMVQSVGLDSKAPVVVDEAHPHDVSDYNPVDGANEGWFAGAEGVLEWEATDNGNGFSGEAGGVNHRWWLDDGSVAKSFNTASNNNTVPTPGGDEQMVCRGWAAGGTTDSDGAPCTDEGLDDNVSGAWIPHLGAVTDHYWNVAVTFCDRSGNCVTTGNTPDDHVAVHASQEFIVDDPTAPQLVMSSVGLPAETEYMGGEEYWFNVATEDNVELYKHNLFHEFDGWNDEDVFSWLWTGDGTPLHFDDPTDGGDDDFVHIPLIARAENPTHHPDLIENVMYEFGSESITTDVEFDLYFDFIRCLEIYGDDDSDIGDGAADDDPDERTGGALSFWTSGLGDDVDMWLFRVWDHSFDPADGENQDDTYGTIFDRDDWGLIPTIDDCGSDDIDTWSAWTGIAAIQFNEAAQSVQIRGQSGSFLPHDNFLDWMIGLTLDHTGEEFEDLILLDAYIDNIQDDGVDPDDRIITIKWTNGTIDTFGHLNQSNGELAVFSRCVATSSCTP